MENQILINEAPEVRLRILKDSCDKVEKFSYLKTFTNEELVEFKNDLSKIMINVDSIETEFCEIKSKYKEQLKPLRDEIKKLLVYVRDKARSVKEECYITYEGEFALYYNAGGEMIHQRPLEASERQKTIFMETRNIINE